MTRWRGSIVGLLALAGLAGCSVYPDYVPGHPASVYALDDLLAYSRRTAELSGPELKAELAGLTPPGPACSARRMRIAVLAGRMPGAVPAHADVLAPCLSDVRLEGTAMGDLVWLLHRQLQLVEQRRVLAGELEERTSENRSLRRKLEQLRDLERSIRERDRSDSEQTGGTEP